MSVAAEIFMNVQKKTIEVVAAIIIHDGNLFATQFHLTMHCYLCSIISGQLSLLEHEDARWLTKDNLNSVSWLPADLEIIPLIAERM